MANYYEVKSFNSADTDEFDRPYWEDPESWYFCSEDEALIFAFNQAEKERLLKGYDDEMCRSSFSQESTVYYFDTHIGVKGYIVRELKVNEQYKLA